jgi:hypothetical protein
MIGDERRACKAEIAGRGRRIAIVNLVHLTGLPVRRVDRSGPLARH